MGDSLTDFVIIREVGALELVAATLLYAVVPPVLLLGLEQVVPSGLRGRFHLLLVAGLAAIGAMYVLRLAFPSGGLAAAMVLVVAALLGVAFMLLYRSRSFLPRLLTALSPSPFVFAAIFLVSPAHAVVFPGEGAEPIDPPGDAAPVVMVVLDELPTSTLLDSQGRIDSHRFPNIAKLARDGVWYRNAVAAADSSHSALPALTSGRQPSPGTLPVASEHAENIFALFGGPSQVVAGEHATRLCDVAVCPPQRSLAGRTFELLSTISLATLHAVGPKPVQDRLPVVGRSWGEALASKGPEDAPDPEGTSPAFMSAYPREQFRAFIERVEGVPRDGGSRLVFFHSTLPHSPWMYYPSGVQYAGVDDPTPGLTVGEDVWPSAPGIVAQSLGRHVLQAQFADAMLGGLIEALRERGLYDRSAIALVADHGVSFVAGGHRRALTGANQADVAMVPTIIKAPGQRDGRTDDRLARAIDVLPTLAELANLDLSWKPDGRSLLDRRPEPQTFPFTTAADQVELRVANLLRQRDRTVARNHRMLGDPLQPLRPLPGGALVGRSLERLRLDEPLVSIDDADRYREIDPEAPFVPGVVQGTVENASPGDLVAVAVDDRILAVAPTFERREGRRYAALLPPGALRQASVELEAAVVARPVPARLRRSDTTD